jgi:hypothetical protein
MWTLTPDNLEQTRSELKERRTAIEARFAAELKDIDENLEEVETLERVARSYSAKYLSGPDIVSSKTAEEVRERTAVNPAVSPMVSGGEHGPVELTTTDPTPEVTGGPQPVTLTAESSAAPPRASTIAELQSEPMAPAVATDSPPRGGSARWRIRIPSDA